MFSGTPSRFVTFRDEKRYICSHSATRPSIEVKDCCIASLAEGGTGWVFATQIQDARLGQTWAFVKRLTRTFVAQNMRAVPVSLRAPSFHSS